MSAALHGTERSRRAPAWPPGLGRGSVSLAQWDRARARGKDRGRIVALWDDDLNEDTPDEVSYGSAKQRWFRCTSGHPPWRARVNTMTSRRTGCPYCAGQKVAAGVNDLASSHPALVGEWHPTRNRELTAQQVTAGTHRHVWWRCSDCSFEWSAGVYERTRHGTGCPHCAGMQAAPGVDDLATTHPQLVREWNRRRNVPLTPYQVTAESHRSAWWRCSKCRFEWRTQVRYRTRLGTGCPACAGHVVLPGRSFADLNMIRPGEWSERNDLPPTEYAPRSSRTVWRCCLRCGSEYRLPVWRWAIGRQHRCARAAEHSA